ncbi:MULTISPECIES: glutamine--fructose-6-phosphate transaminase (isomerizing) [Burkholderia]|uniref:Glutamine--fructose-6-phosphate aminotransferase [isomerizing] n=3 Tax=Burkholderia vietnamiensis TaxID=60552 RepID=A4JIF8_BURVG|nr:MULTISPECIES: glutamine--fructose-6-phosphate transaminase (isomerizing) [Burkholderia]ABO56061.1 glutamine--fructose-6-phosphate transaminase [Burkholderia vietnamiensis G4]AOK42129.1 glutamine--fructose-6-phosphate aminotransferase [Burkholderia vietnamiensis]KVD99817.1 glutamine--fructose-6-phosphate aminotransferase [Burkholderia vietnamiensis]KVE64348.1 glutamine--fructose-6-phosphate aminotransferase [Burkholderia vietnamiensis]KVF08036.1 glutamine--fructose-6-phosphate aminotransfera
MCGIVGAVAQRNIVPVLIEGLRRLEYRGYDSCGVAVLEPDAPRRARSVARVADLDAQVHEAHLEGTTGVAHTRWATHGAPVTQNAHPIFSSNALALVHNGIIENFETLRDALRAKGYEFVSQTDTEVIAHLVHSLYRGDLFEAVREAVQQLHGAYAIAVTHKDQPHTVVGARQGSPLVVGHGDGENFLASDALALAGSTDRFTFLEEGDVCELSLDGVKIVDRHGALVERETRVVSAYGGAVELGPYRHFMQKEIFEQPRAISDTVPQTEAFDPTLFGAAASAAFANIDSLLILACGTSYYSGLTAKYWLESIAKIPTQVEIASEYRYRESVPNPRQLVLVISQSGETADTLAALKHAQSLGHTHTLAVCNVATSAMVRLTEMQFLTHAGTEIGVASTKAFTTQLVALFVLAATLGKLRGHVDAAQEAQFLKQLRHLPAALNSVLALEPQIIAWSEEFARKENALFLGRGLHYPIALEGALKLKEISYIHAEAYPAGELKHGPLALVTEAMPVVTVAPNDTLLEKLKSNMQEVRARGGELYVFADADTQIVNDDGLHVIRMPEHYGQLSPILHVVPLQLLAYHTACARGTDVDKPRNLAKSVTVE